MLVNRNIIRLLRKREFPESASLRKSPLNGRQKQQNLAAKTVVGDRKDQVIAALRRQLDEIKQQLVAEDQELRGKQREIDRLYGKLAAGSPLIDEELRQRLQSALTRLARTECQ